MSLYFTIKQFIKFIFNQFYILTDHHKEHSIRPAQPHSSLPARLWPICSRLDCLEKWGSLFILSGHGQIDKNKNRVFTLVLHRNDHWT